MENMDQTLLDKLKQILAEVKCRVDEQEMIINKLSEKNIIDHLQATHKNIIDGDILMQNEKRSDVQSTLKNIRESFLIGKRKY